ncbi:hypothetical protein, partial [Erwinia pyri]|uniref:hypothetical protein n=1 Tax=Erwinia pyri TaxID=3062598 RepID=UPI0027419D50
PNATPDTGTPTRLNTDVRVQDYRDVLEAITNAETTQDLPAIIPVDNSTPQGIGYYLEAHLGTVRSALRDALKHVRVQNSTDVEALLSTVLTELVNQRIRSRSNELGELARGKANTEGEILAKTLKSRLRGCMERTALLREFSPDEVKILTEHVKAGRNKFAENLASRNVAFLAEDPDWQSAADALAASAGAKSVTVDIEPVQDAGNSVLVRPQHGGWVLCVWAESGWYPIQASAGIAGQARADRASFNALRSAAGKSAISTSGGLFRDELR